MTLPRFAFWFFVFWIVGCGLVATGVATRYIIVGTALCGAVFLCIGALREQGVWFWFAVLFLGVIAGAGYALWYRSVAYNNISTPMYGEQTIEGSVVSSPRIHESTQSFIIKTSQQQKIFVQTLPAYTIRYADTVSVSGKLDPFLSSTPSTIRNGVLGTVSFARVNFITSPKNFSLRRFLYDVRDLITGIFAKVFSREQSALAGGLLLGQESVSFPRAFQNDMKLSGTTHLVALSGYNIVIVIQVLYGLFSFVLSRKKSFLIMIVGIVLFVLMTGAESSVVRAAIMGSLLLAAQRLSRIYDFSQAMAATAWVMILFDPLSFAFDIGFVLSFVSLWGLAYFAPVVFWWIKQIPVFPDWLAQAFSQTVGAQIAVMPLLFYWFGGVSVSGVITNVVLLPLVPLAMALSFIVGVAGLVFLSLGILGSFAVSPILEFFVQTIHIGAKFGFVHYSLSWLSVGIVYILFLWIGLRYGRKKTQEIAYQV